MAKGDAALATRLKAAMAHAGLNQTQLEQKAGLTEGYMSRPLKGERSNMAGERLTRIAKACGVNPVWLMTGDGSMLAPHEPPRELTVERDTTPPPQMHDDETPLERAITAAFDPTRYSRHDLNAAADAARTLHRWAKTGSDPSWARDFLEAAKRMRVEGEPTTPQAVKDRVIAMRLEPETDATRAAKKATNDEARRLSEQFDEPSTGKRR
jgi:transcriptional regulator with XRE-family HTH domain